MAAPIVYRSSDASAPQINGQAGSLVSVLDGVLVNGYGTKTAAGWTKSFSATNKASYRMGGGNLFYLDVDDSAAQTAAGKEANLRGYETMTAVGTGTNPFPTTAQLAAPGFNIRKSITADATSRAWVIIADDRTFYMWVTTGDSGSTQYGFTFGDIYSYKSGDAGRTILSGRTSANTGGIDAVYHSNVSFQNSGSQYWWNQGIRMYIARASTGAAGALGASRASFSQEESNGSSGPMWIRSPDPLNGQIYIARYYIGITGDQPTGGLLRGYHRGLWRIMASNSQGPNDGDTFDGTGDLAGRSFMVIAQPGGSGYYLALETTAWDTSS